MEIIAKFSVLIVDDEPSSLLSLGKILEISVQQVYRAPNGNDALKTLANHSIDIVITDLVMPGMDGFALLRKIKLHFPQVMVFLFTGQDSFSLARKGLDLGADAFLLKPLDPDQLQIALAQASEKRKLQEKIEYLDSMVKSQWAKKNIIGQSKPIRDLLQIIEKARRAKANVLITGESGTGKELVSRAIFDPSHNPLEKFVSVNCAAIPEGLIESEFFGHVRGAFSGAITDRKGLFEMANGGTLFLDEIGEIPLHIQTKLLRVLQEKEVRRVGDNQIRSVEVRVISATNKDLKKLIEQGSFREDLYYRLNVIPVRIPSLRERIEDLPLLVEHFFQKHKTSEGPQSIDPQSYTILKKYPFPGNVRELENILQRAISLTSNSVLQARDFLPYLQEADSDFAFQENNTSPLNAPNQKAFSQIQNSNQPPVDFLEEQVYSKKYSDFKKFMDTLEENYLYHALKQTSGNVQEASDLVQMGRTAFHNKIHKYKIDLEKVRKNVS